MYPKERVYQLEIADPSMNWPGAAGAIGASIHPDHTHFLVCVLALTRYPTLLGNTDHWQAVV